MATETTIPILPCRDIDEIADFYRVLGFERTYRQTRPNPYAVLRRGGIELHFAAISGFDPERSYGSCIVAVEDTADLFEEFAAGMRAAYGRLLVSGIPRITRPRRRRNTGSSPGFSVVDPGGNWIRVFGRGTDGPAEEAAAAPAVPLARALENAIVLGEAKGDHRQAAKILDGKLAGDGAGLPAATLVEALVYRAELAVRLDDPGTAELLLDRVEATALDTAQRARLADALANAAELRTTVRADRAGRERHG
ncbi:VOC family protein [Marinitenerispora sediminis]|uniref:VOC family protein n=1 Tax=Marinitenerispora sediminis TaxID=1931232 RepID=A0A368T7S1_9ACTN|nr:VOC family protein [Marinitenerispora sediminis]RCV50919.1 hypothetical protein DEF28_16840 [Marinitenerispora sediminis]RCV59721.1 hypothetical protein DEF23_06525 [Marinitenerispora sediminis]RCV59827.1 hypothetical protein DEF24_08705 [Marinitenerispora sediminis]